MMNEHQEEKEQCFSYARDDAHFAQPLYNSNHLGWPTMTAPAEPAV